MPFACSSLQQARREVQAGGRRGGGAGLTGIDGLVALRVAQLFVDVGRQGHVAHLGEVGLDRLGKLDQPLGTFQDLKDLRFWTVFYFHTFSYAQPFSTHQGFPGMGIAAAEQKKLHTAAGILAGIDTGRDDAASGSVPADPLTADTPPHPGRCDVPGYPYPDVERVNERSSRGSAGVWAMEDSGRW